MWKGCERSMTLSDAEKITKYIKRLNELKSKLNNYESCDTISGTINIGQNGLGFAWGKNSLEMQWLINGVKSEIEKINKIISDIKIVESVAEETEKIFKNPPNRGSNVVHPPPKTVIVKMEEENK